MKDGTRVRVQVEIFHVRASWNASLPVETPSLLNDTIFCWLLFEYRFVSFPCLQISEKETMGENKKKKMKREETINETINEGLY